MHDEIDSLSHYWNNLRLEKKIQLSCQADESSAKIRIAFLW